MKRLDKKLAVVAIPVYRGTLEWWEKVSLAQARRVFGAYDICFFAPNSLGLPYAGQNARIERFDDASFQNRDAYSRLMLSTEFYERFSDYEYLLLYQLDAFVFSDRLQGFCAMGYDYIGAPVKRYDANWKDFGCFVGNGGLSLRKIDSTLRVLSKKEQIFAMRPKSWKENRFLKWEDLFFAFCSTIPELDFHVPDVRTALMFSVSEDTGRAHRKMPDNMPFGCHAWNRIDYWFWKPLIERYGYRLPEASGALAVHWKQRILEQYATVRVLREKSIHSAAALNAVRKLFPEGRELAFWGGGRYGTLALRLCKSAGHLPKVVFDRNAVDGDSLEHVPVVPPDIKRGQCAHPFILVTTSKYEDEICTELSKNGLHENGDYMRLTYVMHVMLRAYVHSFA